MRVLSYAAASLVALVLPLLVAPDVRAEDATKLPVAVPDADAQAAAQKLILETYKTELANAKLPDGKIALAKKMLLAADSTRNGPAGQYVLITTARDLAVTARDADAAVAAAVQMAASFDVDLYSTKLDNLSRVLAEARRVRDTPLVNKLTAQISDLKEGKANYDRVVAASAVLEKNPTDPAANVILGKFQCFGMGNWDKGLPMLATGSDLVLKSLAQKELAKPTETVRLMEVADGWWDVSLKQTGVMQGTVQKHAAAWYEKALPNLVGLGKTKAEKRINEAAGATGGPVTILKAAYGTPDRATDITKKIVASAMDIGIIVRADATLLGLVDTSAASPRQLGIEYSVQGKSASAVARQGELIVLLNPVKVERKGMFLVKALYGVGCTWVDVTPILHKALTARQPSIAVSNSTMGGDPSTGSTKVCVVIYSTDGKLSWTPVIEGGKIPFPAALLPAP
jgi:hypothetical protein